MAEDAILNDPDGDADAGLEGRAGLRAELRQRRLAATPAERMAAAESIAVALLAHPRFPDSGYVAGYWAMNGEAPLHVLQMRLSAGHTWCLPCIQPDLSLRFAPWRPGDPLVSNRFGIPEPDWTPSSQLEAAEMSVLLLPLLGFTDAGQRLGMGGGYYDRTLAFRQQAPAPPWLVGAGYSFQRLESLPEAPWDVRLDAIATEQGVIEA
jgi:5-formyltetrahydrofolate cyclo-ligase